MPPAKRRKSSIFQWVLTAAVLGSALWVWQSRQLLLDTYNFYQYKPTAAVERLGTKAGLTDDSTFMFYASRPSIESSESFNDNCQRKEADSPILGCYRSNRIYVYDISDKRLDGIQTVTAAHELLHAVYERLSDAEKDTLDTLLKKAYEKNKTKALVERMKYYEKTEPGESFNELHSIAGTEFKVLDPELEKHYTKYFEDRSALVRLHVKVDTVFTNLSKEAENLVTRIDNLVVTINAQTRQYNLDTKTLNDSIKAFNQRAQRSGGFRTQNEFQQARAQLLSMSDALADSRQTIQANIATYKSLVSQLDAINAESASLNKSLDSTLSDVPTL